MVSDCLFGLASFTRRALLAKDLETLAKVDHADSSYTTLFSGSYASLSRMGCWSVSCGRVLRFPAITLVTYLVSVSFGSLIIAATSLQQTFHTRPYGFSYLIIGFLFLSVSVGPVFWGPLGW